jgi:CBS domain containing-hemolysin-like protein
MLPIMIISLAPLVWGSRQITRVIAWGKPVDLPRHREELLAVASLGQAAGQIDSSEVRFMKNMLQLHAVKASDVMTPRTVVFSLPANTSLAEFGQKIKGAAYTRIPLFNDENGRICGFVIKHEVLAHLLERPSSDAPLQGLIRQIPSVLDELPVDKLFHRMIAEHHHIMAVVDE